MIGLEVVLMVLQGWSGSKLVALHLFSPFFRAGGGALIYSAPLLAAAVIYMLVVRAHNVRRERFGFWVVLVAISCTLLAGAARQLAYRSIELTPQTDNDGAVQTRAAAAFLLHGVDPYGADYRQTDFRTFPSPAGPQYSNVALDHYAYFPLQFLLMVPTVGLNDWLHLGLDTQLIYFVFFLFYATLVVVCGREWRGRTKLLLLSAGNPWFWALAFAGWNDIVFVFFLALAGYSLMRRWPVAAGLAYGLALASKQTAWLTLPLWAILVWRLYRPGLGSGWRPLYLLPAFVALVVIGPFFLWNPGAFLTDTVRYVSGAIPHTFAISGESLLQYLRIWGFVGSAWANIPSWPTQLVAFIGTSWLGWRALRANPRASIFLAWSAAVIFTVTLFSRFAPDNYFLAIAELVLAAYALDHAERQKT